MGPPSHFRRHHGFLAFGPGAGACSRHRVRSSAGADMAFSIKWALLALMAAAPAAAQDRAPAINAGDTVTAELGTNDGQRRSGKYEDVYLLQGRRGARVELRLASEDFDSFLLVTG